jgi:hypothetical protein
MATLTDRPAVILRISRLWHPEMDEDDVYDAVRGWWVIGPKREQCEYAIAVAHGVIRGVFQINVWRPRRKGDDNLKDDEPGKPRWGFDGAPAPGLRHLLGRDVSDLFAQGAANPVTYLNL